MIADIYVLAVVKLKLLLLAACEPAIGKGCLPFEILHERVC